ncbi:hypothetical protein P7K49_011943 [Saguinus oedipus]|uniref:Dynein heavy chain tail domain-containing protein n=1 Tax=Saguinus oedipus TaxID=9490 RepID=A0ABQ9VS26_SAGOE|nr:hypothetical protein P7K49_011943 [Saguinus oedipus]
MTMAADVRVEYLEEVASIVLKFKPDKWSKLISAEENVALLTEFLEKPDVLVLVLTLNVAGMVVPCLGFPESLKSKGVYFIKKKPENITKDNYKAQLLYGDISPTPVDQLIVVVEEVLYSLLNQSKNMDGWPQVVSEDIVKQVHRLKNEMYVMSGKIKGKTLLPIPEHLGILDGTLESVERIPSSLDNSLLHTIETIIIDWSHQIRDVLSKDSAQVLLDGLHPLPRVEFEFWDTRLMNLKCIHEQVRPPRSCGAAASSQLGNLAQLSASQHQPHRSPEGSVDLRKFCSPNEPQGQLNRPKVNKIVEILEKAKSCYLPALQNVYTSVTEGLKEASDIVLYLKPLRILLEEMEQVDFTMVRWQGRAHFVGGGGSCFSEACGAVGFLAAIRLEGLKSRLSSPPWGPSPGCLARAMGRGGLGCQDKLPTFIAKVLDTICLIWATSEYYNTPVRIIVILQEFCNQIIEMVARRWPRTLWPPAPLLPFSPSLPGWGLSLVHSVFPLPVFSSSLKAGQDVSTSLFRPRAEMEPSSGLPRVLLGGNGGRREDGDGADLPGELQHREPAKPGGCWGSLSLEGLSPSVTSSIYAAAIAQDEGPTRGSSLVPPKMAQQWADKRGCTQETQHMSEQITGPVGGVPGRHPKWLVRALDTRTFLSPEEVLKGLQGEIEEVLSGISLSVNVLKEFYQTYDFCCMNMKLFFKVPLPRGARAKAETRDKKPVPWEFPPSLAFSRMNSFFHRVQTIEVKTEFGTSDLHFPDCSPTPGHCSAHPYPDSTRPGRK